MEIALKKKILEKVHPDKTFKTRTGAEIWGLQDLLDFLEIMDEETFKHHVTSHRNDFAQWIEDVLGDTGLSKQLRKTRDSMKTQELLAHRIQELEQELKFVEKNEQEGLALDITKHHPPLPPKKLDALIARDLPPLEFIKLNAQLVMLGMAIGILIGVVIGVFLGGYR